MEEEEGTAIEGSVRRWEDMCMDCLIKVFERVGLQSLILDIPFVCKSWYKASLDPLIYKLLHFELLHFELMYVDEESSRWATTRVSEKIMYSHLPPSIEFIKIAVNRSCGMATEVVFPDDDYSLEELFSGRALEYVLERCPELKTLILPYFDILILCKTNEYLLKAISKLKHLESLATLNIDDSFSMEILNEIHIHCQYFQSLTARGYISDHVTSEIVTLLPNIKHLVLRDCSLARDNLIRILSGCSKLELLDVTCCKGFDGDDALILKLASHINIFKSEGSVVINDEEDSDDDMGWMVAD